MLQINEVKCSPLGKNKQNEYDTHQRPLALEKGVTKNLALRRCVTSLKTFPWRFLILKAIRKYYYGTNFIGPQQTLLFYSSHFPAGTSWGQPEHRHMGWYLPTFHRPVRRQSSWISRNSFFSIPFIYCDYKLRFFWRLSDSNELRATWRLC